LETMEEIHSSSSRASVHHRSTNVQHGRDDHRPTSGTNDCGQRETQDANGTKELAKTHLLNIASFASDLLRRWTSISALFVCLLLRWWVAGFNQCLCSGSVQIRRHASNFRVWNLQ
jgi:hypothetical protein